MTTHSENIAELATALAKAQGEIQGAKKDSANPFFKHNYADLSSAWDACREALSRNGLAVIQSPEVETSGEAQAVTKTSRSGEERSVVSAIAKVTVSTLLVHTSGQWVRGSMSCWQASADPQAIGSGITYLRRYSLMAFVGIAAEDDDGEAAMARPANGKAKAEPVAPDGFKKWLDDMGAIAQHDGIANLRAAWKEAKAEYRQHLTAVDPKAIDRLKALAEANGAKAAR